MKKLTLEEKTKKNRLFVKLSWRILECKFCYYNGAAYGIKPISDDKYDLYEDKYRKLAKELKLKPTACDMVGFDSSRGLCRIVMENMIRSKGKTKITFKKAKDGRNTKCIKSSKTKKRSTKK